MKKLVLITACLTLLTGCEADMTELGNRAVIQAAAIDFNGNYQVSALLFSGGGSGGDTIDASRENVIKVSGEGETLSEAIDNISLIDGKKLYMAETKLLILGSGFEKVSAADALETLYFDMRCSLNMPVCCAESAEFLTDLQFTEGITSAEKPLMLIENAHRMGVSPKTTLLDLLSDSVSGRASLLPRLAPVRNGRGMTSSEDGKTAVLNGSRHMKSGKLNGYYDAGETAALMLMSKKSDKIMLNYLHNDTEQTCEAYSVRVIPDGKNWRVSAKFRTRNGGGLSESEQRAALSALTELISTVA